MPRINKPIEQKIAERKEYMTQFPRFLEVEINGDLTPLQMLLIALIRADIRTVPLMQTCMVKRARNTIYTALDGLRKKGILIVYKNLYWLSETPLDEVRTKTRAYWRSKRNPGGRIPRRQNLTDHEEVHERFLELARQNKKWRRLKPVNQPESTTVP